MSFLTPHLHRARRHENDIHVEYNTTPYVGSTLYLSRDSDLDLNLRLYADTRLKDILGLVQNDKLF